MFSIVPSRCRRLTIDSTRAEIGQHHRISGRYLYQYANEMAWRED
jgi:hypothetical protein